MPIEVGAHAEDDMHPRFTSGGHERGDEAAALMLIVAEGERLLVLIDDDRQAGFVRSAAQNLGARGAGGIRRGGERLVDRAGRDALRICQVDGQMTERLLTGCEEHNQPCAAITFGPFGFDESGQQSRAQDRRLPGS
ncbi:hypothetical protein ITP53_10840 [Nonomuraea sp. K274]|uniref:Uncharacterized protein n=1 Tax=Nonomuraea cypriaca TaxID=1187855 RepID=A0A931A7S2_9ACTN|nr:hypothetical protein [Nonomuraea cypriaca]